MISLNLIVICVKVVFSLGWPDDQYICLYLLESKIGYMALKTSEQALSFDAGFLAKSMFNLDKKPGLKYNACWVVSRANMSPILHLSRYNQAYWLLKTIVWCAFILELIFSSKSLRLLYKLKKRLHVNFRRLDDGGYTVRKTKETCSRWCS